MGPSQQFTISSLSYILPSQLADVLRDEGSASKTAVVDVRDNDYLGGHINSSIRAPINELDARMPELLRTLKDKDRVVFHCMLSQQRGPKAALAYARAKAADQHQRLIQVTAENGEVEQQQDAPSSKLKVGGQEILVLEGGFGMWQSRYGSDKKLTEGYVKELWESVLG